MKTDGIQLDYTIDRDWSDTYYYGTQDRQAKDSKSGADTW